MPGRAPISLKAIRIRINTLIDRGPRRHFRRVHKIHPLRAANTHIADDFTNGVTNALAKVRPTVNIGTALLISMPS
ncbi:hypothetical protein MB901379_04079 [Mycobacterium basiliense]|uniref:Uncharacterized protein n=1 Tax=Mycobacterium basiliense TaxID=2094119 RepID=A0A447GJ00_9MYCO|nr:hypothetical protein [Mycobacterium basiliense]VDM90477.1 hypothetical protein MB901379_04079 [Mycobacterium basiliense]